MGVPTLRFPEFRGEWENKKLGDIAKFSKGKGISKSEITENGETECIRYGELYTKYHEVIDTVISKTNVNRKHLILSEANDVIIPASGETQIDIATASCVIKSGIALGGDLNIIKTKNNGVFISYYLNNCKKLEIANLAQGISVVHLYSSQLASLRLNLPSILEQTKIANFLTAFEKKAVGLENQITLQEQYKSGMMLRIFSKEVRFKDESGKDYPEWEEKTLGEIADFYKGKGLSKSHLKENGEYKCIHYGELFTKYKELVTSIISSTDEFDNPFLSVSNDVLMPTSDVTPNGLATASCIKEDGILLGGDILIIRQKKMVLDGLYLSYYLAQNRDKVMKLVSGSTVYHLYGSDMKNLELSLPCLSEQTQIANFLSSLDAKISATRKQVEIAKEWKKGLLQQMFVSNDAVARSKVVAYAKMEAEMLVAAEK